MLLILFISWIIHYVLFASFGYGHFFWIQQSSYISCLLPCCTYAIICQWDSHWGDSGQWTEIKQETMPLFSFFYSLQPHLFTWPEPTSKHVCLSKLHFVSQSSHWMVTSKVILFPVLKIWSFKFIYEIKQKDSLTKHSSYPLVCLWVLSVTWEQL